MHVLFVHQNFPAQFGHVARYLIRAHGVRCTFVSEKPAGMVEGIRRIRYAPKLKATPDTLYLTRGFENGVGHALGVYNACKSQLKEPPDLIVGHSGFGSTLFLRELYDCPIINYFEYFYRPKNSDLDFRPEFPIAEIDRLRIYPRNAMFLLDLENCDAGYSPTRWQHSTLPRAYSDKVEVIFDGVETSVWRKHEGVPRAIGDRKIGPNTRIITYVSRGFESMRGFDIFMKVAKRIYRSRPDVLFLVVGADRVAYGGDLKYIQEQSFLKHVLKQDDYDLSKFVFTGLLPPQQLARLLSISDLHLYLTVPFVLSWSLFNALACGCSVVASDTDPVREVIQHGENGLLAPFYDVEGMAELGLRVLEDPEAHRALGREGMRRIDSEYALDKTLPRMLDLYRKVAEGRLRTEAIAAPPPSVRPRPAGADRILRVVGAD
ncbi:glycosyltransferase [Tautonia sociabilis]|uniref:Glycosyltransferase n=1 Tax=Tautonia sociabilis TaxID=2080755 RepID=A0A432ML85_9BACT|nr:glycosyltransferase [Tautonia sociabilis]RUL87848.1 glycosyltransferase [Tautonia sociabilis]